MPTAMVHPTRSSVLARSGAALPLISQHRRRRVRRSNPHSASRTLTVPVPRFPPLAVCVRRPSVYAAPTSSSLEIHCRPRQSNGHRRLKQVEPTILGSVENFIGSLQYGLGLSRECGGSSRDGKALHHLGTFAQGRLTGVHFGFDT